MKHSIVTITPQMAQQMLESNANNRKLDMRTANQYADTMIAGNWKINGEAIKFSKTGKLLDGQHRLKDCVLSGKDLVTMMVEGLDDEIFTTLDQGKKRTTAQILAIAGHVSTYQLAAAVRYVNVIERKLFRPTIGGSIGGMTSQEVKEWIEAHTFIVEAIKEGGRLSKLCTASGAAACYYLMYLRDPELTHKYFMQLFTGENLKRGDPALAVRNALIRIETKGRAKSFSSVAFIIRGWNALRKNQELVEVRDFYKNKAGEYIALEIE